MAMLNNQMVIIMHQLHISSVNHSSETHQDPAGEIPQFLKWPQSQGTSDPGHVVCLFCVCARFFLKGSYMFIQQCFFTLDWLKPAISKCVACDLETNISGVHVNCSSLNLVWEIITNLKLLLVISVSESYPRYCCWNPPMRGISHDLLIHITPMIR